MAAAWSRRDHARPRSPRERAGGLRSGERQPFPRVEPFAPGLTVQVGAMVRACGRTWAREVDRIAKIALAGRRDLTQATVELVDEAIRDELPRLVHGSHRDIVGITCLAPGAQQLLARAVADLGGELEVVLPTENYAEQLPEEARAEYQSLLAHSRRLHSLPAAESAEAAYREAGRYMLVLADRLLAVWDGTDPHGADATADLVFAARERGLPVTVLWPTGARRSDQKSQRDTSSRTGAES